MWGTKIDSIDVSINGDTLYYNYPIFRDTTPQNEWCNCSWWNAPNWNGVLTKIEVDGSSWFYNHYGDSIRMNHTGQVNAEWVAYQYENDDSLLAKVENVFWSDDGWIADSVKTIGFTRFSNGAPISDNINSAKVELYKTAGFRKLLDFERFPFDTTAIYQLDVNSINLYSPGYEVNGEIRPAPAIGDGFHRIRNCNDYANNMNCYGMSEVSEYVSDVITDTISGEIAATVLRNIHYHGGGFVSSTQSLIYTPLPDTFVSLPYGMPLQGSVGYYYHPGQLVSSPEYCEYPIVTVFTPQAECTYGNNSYAAYIGEIEASWNEDDGWCTNSYLDFHIYYNYLATGDLICGQPLMVGIEDAFETPFHLHPNPTSESVQIQLKQPEEIELVVTDVLGRSFYSKTLRSAQRDKFELDVSDWPNGIYPISIINKHGIRSTQRLIVQH